MPRKDTIKMVTGTETTEYMVTSRDMVEVYFLYDHDNYGAGQVVKVPTAHANELIEKGIAKENI